MKSSTVLTIASLLAILFMTLHITDDILRDQGGVAEGGFLVLIAVVVLIVWLYAVLLLPERRSGLIIQLVGSFLASFVAFAHLTGLADDTMAVIAKASGPFFTWVVVGLGLTAIFALIVSARRLFMHNTN